MKLLLGDQLGTILEVTRTKPLLPLNGRREGCAEGILVKVLRADR
jgi:hypothetical protein